VLNRRQARINQYDPIRTKWKRQTLDIGEREEMKRPLEEHHEPVEVGAEHRVVGVKKIELSGSMIND
jgi:hypothetical protein